MKSEKSYTLTFTSSHSKKEWYIKLSQVESVKNIAFVCVDKNCKLKVRTKAGKFYGFSDENEFMKLCSWIDKNDAAFEEHHESYVYDSHTLHVTFHLYRD